MRWSSVVVAVVAAACGAGGTGGKGVDGGEQCNPKKGGYLLGRDAAERGRAGEACVFGGGAVMKDELSPVVTCFSGTLLMQKEEAATAGRCAGASVPVVDGDCVERCGAGIAGSGGERICAIVPEGSGRTLATPWNLDDQASCDAVMTGCPRVNDPCTGSFLCRGTWPRGHTVPTLIGRSPDQVDFEGTAWCASGKLRIVWGR